MADDAYGNLFLRASVFGGGPEELAPGETAVRFHR